MKWLLLGLTLCGPAFAPPAGSVQPVAEQVRQLLAELAGEPLYRPDIGPGFTASQQVALKRLVAIGAPAVEPLIGVTRDAHWWRRCLAAQALGDIGDRRGIPALVEVLAKDQDVWARWHALLALERLRTTAATAAIVGALKDPEAFIRYHAALGLGRLEEQQAIPLLVGLLGDSPPDDLRLDPGSAAADALGRMGAPAVEPLLAVAQSPDSATRRNAAAALAALRDRRAQPALVRLLGDVDPRARMEAAEGLGALKDRGSVQALVVALADEEAGVRAAAAKALGAIRDPRAYQPLLDGLRAKDSPQRDTFAAALGALGDPRAYQPLIEALKDRDSFVCAAAALGLGPLGDRPAERPLIRSLTAPQEWVRAMAAVALGELRSRAATDPLIRLLTDPERGPRSAAATALAQLGDPRALPALKKGYGSDAPPTGEGPGVGYLPPLPILRWPENAMWDAILQLRRAPVSRAPASRAARATANSPAVCVSR